MKTKFAILFSKPNEGKVILTLRGVFTILFLAINGMAISQITIDAITTGYHTCYMDGVLVDKHTDKAKAVTHCNELKLNNNAANVWFTYPTQTRIEASGIVTIEIDTIQVNRRLDVDGRLVGGFYDGVEGEAYFLTNEIKEMIGFTSDSLNSWQSIYNFKRIKSFGKVSYENLEVPFQYIDIWFDEITDTSAVIHVKITEPYIRINSWIDGVQFKEFNRPNADGNNPFLFRILPLVKGQEYNFKMEVTNQKGEVIIYQTILKI